MYLVLELQKNGDGHVSSIVTEHESLPQAESKYHSVLASAAVSQICVHSAILVSEEGFPVEHRCYRRDL